MPQEEILDIISGKKYSRIPVYEGTVDHIIGILHLIDLLFMEDDLSQPIDFQKYLRKPHFTYNYKPIKDKAPCYPAVSCRIARSFIL